MSASRTLLVIAKAPVPGRSKTRLCPPCTPAQAASLAEAALADTLETVARTPGVTRRVAVLDGEPGPWLPAGFDVVPQVGGGLDARLAAAFRAADGPAFLVGMDTPQLTTRDLRDGLDALTRTSAVVGLASDGGYWGIGLREPDDDLFLGVPMSTEETGAAQIERLRDHGRDPALLRELRDVDRYDDALAVAREAPSSRFARTVARLGADPAGEAPPEAAA